MDRTPNILLLGNGINRCFEDSISWNKLLSELSNGNYTEKDIDKIDCPAPLKAIIATSDCVDKRLSERKRDFFGSLSESRNKYLQKLLDIGFDEIITTNYSYELEMAALDKLDITESQLKRLAEHTSGVDRVEGKYLLHSYNNVNYKGTKQHIWHIHGEARKPDSMILGHYYYANLVSKMKAVSDSRRDSYKDKGFTPKSWIDSFILGNVYILGFGFDFSEVDLWWLLNRKKRENAVHGSTVFYNVHNTGDKDNDAQMKLMDMLSVEVVSVPTDKEYLDGYDDAISKIKERIANGTK